MSTEETRKRLLAMRDIIDNLLVESEDDVVKVARVSQIAREIVAREGGFVNDPDDPGGATKYGVTIHTMRALGIDLDHDGDVDVEDVQMMTREQAVEIFLKHYFEKPRIAELPEELQDSVFDMQVNAGANAVKILQKLLNKLLNIHLAVDGVIGPKTIEAAHTAVETYGPIRNLYGMARRDYYFGLAKRRPQLRKYVVTQVGGKGGWITRAEEFMSPNLHLTHDDFQARIRSLIS